MMKDFIIYVQPRIQEKSIIKRELSLDDLVKHPGTSRLRELERVRNGNLKMVNELEPHRVFNFSCEYRVRTRAREPIFAPINFELWQRKNDPITVTFDAPRKVSRVAVALLSLLIYNDPFAITPISFTATNFLKLKDNVLEKQSGNLTQVFLQNIRSQKGIIRRFLMTGSKVEEFMNIDEMFENASKVIGMGCAIPSQEGKRRLSFRIKHWGGGQIYSPSVPLDHEISELIDLFERILFGNFSNISR